MPINMSTIKLWGHSHSGHGILIIVARPLLLEEQAHPLPVSVPQILLHPSALCFADAVRCIFRPVFVSISAVGE